MTHHARIHRPPRWPQRVTLVTAVLAVSACSYDAPPYPNLTQPKGGIFELGDSLELTFSRPIRAETLALRFWSAAPEDLTLEKEHVTGLAPAIERCTVATSPCNQEVTLAVAPDRLKATIALAGDRFRKVKVPWQLEVLPGLVSDAGATLGVSTTFDFQFAPSAQAQTGASIPFDSGVYVLAATIEEPLPANLTLFVDMIELPSGQFRWAAGKAIAKDGFAKNTATPSELQVDVSDRGFSIFAHGAVTLDGDTRFMATEPFNITIHIGPLAVILSDVRVTGVVRKRAETGHDRVEGTISYAKITLSNEGSDPFEYPPGNTTFFMDRSPEPDIPKNMPRLCGGLCSEQKQCEPPEGWPGAEYCPATSGTPGADAGGS